jgi:catechol 2,3-dioxygenase-like lactoylglutathione lyase family enzyme
MAPACTAVPLWLDHASVAVTSLNDAIALLDARLGLRATVSQGDPDRHSRVYLDRGYLEVASGQPGGGWILSGFFVRFEDLAALRRHLDSSGFRHRSGARHTGVDGRWDDVDTMPGRSRSRSSSGAPPRAIARPGHPLGDAHRCGARTLDAVQVTVPDLDSAVATYTRLIGGRASVVTDREGVRRAEVHLASGRIILAEGGNPGITAIVLGVGSLPATMSVVGPLTGPPIAWLDPAITHGVQFGFVESRAPDDGFGRHDAGGGSQTWNRPASRRTVNNRRRAR